MGKSEEEIAIIFGCSLQSIQQGQTLLEATDVVQKAVETGEIGIGHAVSLAQEAPEVQRDKVAKVKAVNKTETGHERVRKVRDIVAAPVLRVRGKKEILAAESRVNKAIQNDGLRTHLNALFSWMLGDDSVLDAMCEPGELALADQMLADREAEMAAAKAPEQALADYTASQATSGAETQEGAADAQANGDEQNSAAA